MLTFESFDIEAHPECRYDYVEVSYGFDSQTYCGSNKPSPIISSDNRMKVIFRSDDSEARSGFKATWKAVETPSSGMLFGLTYLLGLTDIRVYIIQSTKILTSDCQVEGVWLHTTQQLYLAVSQPHVRSVHFTRQCALRHI